MSRTSPPSRVPLSVTTPDLPFTFTVEDPTWTSELIEINGPCTMEFYPSVPVLDKGARGGGSR